uniref:Uncharacterized protein n=1 Tax=Arundo donax TaxID=35708 RepID=A0A0A8YC86_ARUDO
MSHFYHQRCSGGTSRICFYTWQNSLDNQAY